MITLVALSAAIAVVSVALSRRAGGLWLLDPRGSFALMLFLHTSGVPIYMIHNHTWPMQFGLVPEHVTMATQMLVVGQLGFLIGTLIPRTRAFNIAPKLALSLKEGEALIGVLVTAVVLTGIPQLANTVGQLSEITAMRYGGAQGDFGDEVLRNSATFSNVSFITAPTFCCLIVVWVRQERKLLSGPFIALFVYVVLPVFITGGRRDIMIVLFALWFARIVRKGSTSIRELLILAVFATMLSSAIARSRSGESLGLDDRIAAFQDSGTSDETLFDHSVLMFSGTAVLTAALTVFPAMSPHTWGVSYLQSMANVMRPGFLTGGYAYPPPSHVFRDLFYPGVSGFGLDYTMAAEAYQNFGWLGPGVFFMLLGFGLSLTFDLAREKRPGVNMWLLIHLQLMVSTMASLRTDSNGLFKLVIYGTLWFIALHAIARFWAGPGASRAARTA